MRLLLYAINVHQGGGTVLLNALLSSLTEGAVHCTAFVDERLNVPENLSPAVEVRRIAPTLLSRLGAERTLKRMARAEDTVLCFGNLPPLSRLKARTVLFIQNRYLTDDVSLDHFPKKTRVRLAVERAWLRSFSGNVDTIVVQTPTMKDAVAASLRREATVLPFLVPKHPYRRSVERSEKGADVRHDFLYVASGEPHKNHRRLIEAWKILASVGLFPTLCLTLKEEDGHRALLNFIDTAVREAGLKIVNRGALTQAEIAQLYRQSGALIYPSTLESFGLPLIEARNANLAVVASELDYVRDVLDPEESFDPTSSRSIARAVQRFLGHEEKALPLVDPDSFLNFCMQPTPDLHHGAPGSSG